ncbi:endo-polygalacturonase [Ranunculus cassubicifolius]
MEKSQINLLVSFLVVFFLVPASADLNINVMSLGAKTDGVTDSTQAFLQAWKAACASNQSVTIYVPNGRYFIKQVTFRGPCKNTATTFKIDGTLVAPSYTVLNTANWIYFSRVTGLTIIGGTLDGQGTSFWACRNAKKGCPGGARNLAFNMSFNIRILGLTSINSQVTHIVINKSITLLMQGLKIVAPADSPNTDGIHIQLSSNVTIRGTSISTGDDCVSIGIGTKNLLIEESSCGPGHGISIGSLGKTPIEQGVEGVIVRNIVFTGSENGLRMKSWAKKSNGFIKGVLYQDIIMKNVRNPLVIDQHYCPGGGSSCPKGDSGIQITGVTYRNIQGSSSTKVAVKFDCSRSNPCKDIKLDTVNLTYLSNVAQSFCANAVGVNTGSVNPSCL